MLVYQRVPSCYENIGPRVFLPRDARLTAVELRSAGDILRSDVGRIDPIPLGNQTYPLVI